MFCHIMEMLFSWAGRGQINEKKKAVSRRKGSVFMMDYEKIKAGVRLMLEGIGEDVSREGMLLFL